MLKEEEDWKRKPANIDTEDEECLERCSVLSDHLSAQKENSHSIDTMIQPPIPQRIDDNSRCNIITQCP